MKLRRSAVLLLWFAGLLCAQPHPMPSRSVWRRWKSASSCSNRPFNSSLARTLRRALKLPPRPSQLPPKRPRTENPPPKPSPQPASSPRMSKPASPAWTISNRPRPGCRSPATWTITSTRPKTRAISSTSTASYCYSDTVSPTASSSGPSWKSSILSFPARASWASWNWNRPFSIFG